MSTFITRSKLIVVIWKVNISKETQKCNEKFRQKSRHDNEALERSARALSTVRAVSASPRQCRRTAVNNGRRRSGCCARGETLTRQIGAWYGNFVRLSRLYDSAITSALSALVAQCQENSSVILLATSRAPLAQLHAVLSPFARCSTTVSIINQHYEIPTLTEVGIWALLNWPNDCR